MKEQDAHRDIPRMLARKWKVIALFAALGASLGIAYAVFAPRWYAATLSVVPSQRQQDAAASALAGKLPLALGNVSADVQRIQAVLTSVSVADEVITRFNLSERYESAYIEQARKALWTHCTTVVDRRSSVVSLTCEDQDPQYARDIAAYFGEAGNRVFGRISASSAREERKFLESQVVKARGDVDDASKRLRAFQEKYRIIDLPEQSKAVISAMASLKGDLLSKQLELSYLSSFSASTEAQVVQLRQQIGILEAKLRQLEIEDVAARTSRGVPNSGSAGSASPDESFFPEAMDVPALRYELEQLLREQKIKETVFFLLTQRFETARVDEARDTSTFQILDYPATPTYPSRPRRRKVVATGLLLGVIAGIVIVVVPLLWRRQARSNT